MRMSHCRRVIAPRILDFFMIDSGESVEIESGKYQLSVHRGKVETRLKLKTEVVLCQVTLLCIYYTYSTYCVLCTVTVTCICTAVDWHWFYSPGKWNACSPSVLFCTVLYSTWTGMDPFNINIMHMLYLYCFVHMCVYVHMHNVKKGKAVCRLHLIMFLCSPAFYVHMYTV
jgi:hypothetical protein